MHNFSDWFQHLIFHGKAVRLVEMKEGEIVVSNVPSHEELSIVVSDANVSVKNMTVDPALPGADNTVYIEVTPPEELLIVGCGFRVEPPEINIYTQVEPQPNHPDGWYRKFDKRQRGPKCLK